MKSNRILVACMAAALGAAAMSGQSMAADNATASVTAVVVAPIAITKDTDMVLGNLVGGNGNVTLSTSGARTKDGSTALSTSGTAPAAASFSVTGTGSSTFSISYTGSATELTSGANTMAVDFITESVTGSGAATGKTDPATDAATGTLTSGAAKIYAGAKVTVAADQAAGSYTGNLVVTVAYN